MERAARWNIAPSGTGSFSTTSTPGIASGVGSPCHGTSRDTSPSTSRRLPRGRLSRASHRSEEGVGTDARVRCRDCWCWSLRPLGFGTLTSGQRAGGPGLRRNDGLLGTPYADRYAAAVAVGGVTHFRSNARVEPGRLSVGLRQPPVRSGATRPFHPIWPVVPAEGGA